MHTLYHNLVWRWNRHTMLVAGLVLGAALTGGLFLGGSWVAARAASTSVASLAATGSGSATAAITPATANGYGFSTSLAGLSQPALDQRLAGMKATGATWVRFDLSWAAIQPGSAGQYDWSDYDRITKTVTAHGLKPLMIIDFTPAWARPANCPSSTMCGPADPRAYATFAAAAVRHYQPLGVQAYEIWNEPNISYRFRPAANPATYVAMLKDSYRAIKAVDPRALVIAASTAPSATDGQSYRPDDFLRALYTDGAAGSFDAVSAHPYTYPNTPANAYPDDAWGQLTTMHDIMVANGDGDKRIWITEFGAPTNGPNQSGDHVTEAVQAQTVTEAMTLLRGYAWSGPLFWYDYQDSGSATWTSENFYGLVRADGSFKPAYYAWTQGIAASK